MVIRERADQSIQAPGQTALYLEVPELGVIPSAHAEGSRRFSYYHDHAGLGARDRGLGRRNRTTGREIVRHSDWNFESPASSRHPSP